MEKVQANEINSRMTKRSVIVSFDGTQRSGSTIYLGAPSSYSRITLAGSCSFTEKVSQSTST